MSYTIDPAAYANGGILQTVADRIMAKANVDKNDVARIVVNDTTAEVVGYLRDERGVVKLRNRDNIATETITVVYP